MHMETGRSYSRLVSRLDRASSLTGADKRLLADLPLTVMNIAAGHAIDQSERSQCVLVVSGFVCGSKRVGGTARQIISVAVPGDIIGMHGMLLRGSDHSLSALGPAVVASLPFDALEEVLDQSPRLVRAFWRQSFIEAAILREWITSLGRREAIARVAHLICELVVRLQAVDLAKDGSFALCWTQMDVADVCGISTVHANRVVQELRRLDVVEWDAKQLKICDWERLAKIGEFSAEYLNYPARPSPLPHYAADHHLAS
jgi:CRP-like cAMP-binding protein